jgi:hypothetical protein
MDFLLELILSSFEYFAILVFLFVVFNLDIKDYAPHTIFICFLMSHLSYSLDHIEIENNMLSIAIQCVVFNICVWLLYRINVFYAFFIGTLSYFVYAILQSCIFLVLNFIGFMTYEDLVPLTLKHTVLQLLSIVVPLIISAVLFRIKRRYNFVPTSEHVKIKFGKLNFIIIIVLISTIAVSSLTYHFIKAGQIGIFLGLTAFQFFFITVLLYLSNKKEVKFNDRKVVRRFSDED